MTLATSFVEFDDVETQRLFERLCSLDAEAIYFPVRHHSPGCALLLKELIERLKPSAVLIEGPSDFNSHLDELSLPHQLPIAIFSYFRANTGTFGAYYPFCEYSPEWIAVQSAKALGIPTKFIDLPWTSVAPLDKTPHRYADAELRRSRYVRSLCQRMHVEDFDDLWDKLVESDLDLSLGNYLRRVHSLCFHIRLWEDQINPSDRLREAFMAEQIEETLREHSGRVLIVTGGFHSSALVSRLEGFTCPGIDTPAPPNDEPIEILETGIALTSYSYERLDSLTGYNAGMPSPGFYEFAFRSRQEGTRVDHQPLLEALVEQLREKKQTLSTADLIAVDIAAKGLAAIRGRTQVWRSDLLDAVSSALIKDELEYGVQSPLIQAVHGVLRGKRIGRLASGTRMPPLMVDIRNQLEATGFQQQRVQREVELNLLDSKDLAASRLLHGLRVLGIKGYEFVDGTDFLSRDKLQSLWEKWRISWSPEFEARCIEASRYGPSLKEAVTSKLVEQASASHRSAATSSWLLIQSAQAGIETLSETLLSRLEELIHEEGAFSEASESLSHLLYLYFFDEAFGTAHLPQVASLLGVAFERSLWLLELVGQASENDRGVLKGIQTIVDTHLRIDARSLVDTSELPIVLKRVEDDLHKPPQIRGAAAGARWAIGVAEPDGILRQLNGFANSADLGDFLVGVFALCREVAQRDPRLVQTLDRMLMELGANDFHDALPSLRLAFTYFTPREKHYLLSTLFTSLGLKTDHRLASIAVDHSTAALALQVEERIYETMARYGLGGRDE